MVAATLPSLLAFSLAFTVTFADYVTSKFPGTLCLAVRNRWLYIYAVIYGVFGVVALAAYAQLFGSAAGSVVAPAPASVFSMQNPWMRAATIGLTIKTVMHLKFFEIPSGAGAATPIGIATFLQPFEPLLVREIMLQHWILQTALINPAATKYATLAAAAPRALQAVPGSLGKAEQAAMKADLSAATTVNDLLQIYLSYAGCSLFRQAFP